ncbi:bifunctional diaminohydroxyphosphoribosylaminopyrimidine deaminase/5-amino-6-(5-phosphoribosylamino)uracil reductase RibD [Catenovulum sp. SM1970]|uniref:bifunctional diaminohydroxyphosphoribosylaminopyrimidine deaminase/5-amino-6-(5-phosphoribosylamino)uracil reductase RibD n=1 Tax=Marinifaba aquimaris TaxID=2741323 RepID=UPI0015745A59|nr:bifunctional diaminohydroxyphosphoribosylaminopyrimidine deaminase/5-amino-6-(5-phosphoribosylamino)uracil reductase RibD [Marinifaba aquimaris]NTS77065.1 bifunctional diaminohydroxyphosphoribosylaminopyrimidine deaminase/5-amino-6-(5-phosphoribosylamino)uracil reductase RibD [Marinifaba aquimaris]
MTLSTFDFQMMARAIKLAKKALYTTSPNPRVGCVITQGETIVGEGYHIQAGEPHAEVHAMRAAGENANGATAYVTLEPCSHFGRTPPCALGLINAGVKKVVIGMTDPNPKVSGRGIKMLKDAGIEVISGCLETDAKALNPGFIKRMLVKKPWVRLKMASSLDGRTAMASGESQWITGPQARADVQKYRAMSCAILTGSGTVNVDNPALVVREAQLGCSDYPLDSIRQPLRVVIDNQHSVLAENGLFNHTSPVLMVSNNERASWPHPHVSNLTLEQTGRYVDLNELLLELGKREINEVWLEAGSVLAGAFIEQNLVDELILYQAPKLLAENTQGLLKIDTLTELKQASQWQFQSVTQVGNDLKLVLTPNQECE